MGDDGDEPTTTPAAGMPRWLVPAFLGSSLLIVGLLAVVVVLLMRGGSDEPASATDAANADPTSAGVLATGPETFTVAGDMTLIDSDLLNYGGGCQGQGGYDDMQTGTQVVVTDASGTTLAVGALSTGVKDSSVVCVFNFRVEDVPESAGPFNVEVGHRGTIVFNRDNATDLHLTLS